MQSHKEIISKEQQQPNPAQSLELATLKQSIPVDVIMYSPPFLLGGEPQPSTELNQWVHVSFFQSCSVYCIYAPILPSSSPLFLFPLPPFYLPPFQFFFFLLLHFLENLSLPSTFIICKGFNNNMATCSTNYHMQLAGM